MFVRQLIGREAGNIITLPFVAATSSLAMGTCAPVTDEEIAEAGLIEVKEFQHPSPEEMPRGLRAVPSLGGGFDVVDDGGVILNEGFLPNLPAARSFATDLIASQSTTAALDVEAEVETDVVSPPPIDFDKLTRKELEALAADRDVDVSGARTKDDVIAALQAADQAGLQATSGAQA
ncbi:hypothetical protein ASG25_21860 [Rhizobium sp. Leaf384]|uniref:hypothetical protein n=1 Tax=unclassified Rhizobium TaxID=2613769 RepID=UPI0007137E88|nr:MULTISPECIES: hypothetical protein [unclassified Rhizobium]KQS78088.1 hypothetical protein ASG58_06670 [Rhizobium sp. Leaf383]KQS79705.1 hypothetical protein ASG25_21860 [Rhizobium sp. Leaf384]